MYGFFCDFRHMNSQKSERTNNYVFIVYLFVFIIYFFTNLGTVFSEQLRQHHPNGE